MWDLNTIVQRNQEAADRALRGEREAQARPVLGQVVPIEIAVVFPVRNINSEWIQHGGEMIVNRGYKNVRGVVVSVGIQVGGERREQAVVGYKFTDESVQFGDITNALQSGSRALDLLKDLAVLFGQDTFRATLNGKVFDLNAW